MIEAVLDLQRDGNEHPQYFWLTFRLANQGEGYKQTMQNGTEAHLRGVLANGGIAQAVVDNLFANV
jgi:hypothetical protein